MKNVPHYLPNGDEYKGATHKTGDRLMTGATHTKDSVFLTHKKPLTDKKTSTYKIDPQAFINAERIGVEIKKSKLKNKKLDVFKDGLKVATIGDTRYMDYRSYIKQDGKEFADERRRLYQIRHNKTRGDKGTPSYYADKILWN